MCGHPLGYLTADKLEIHHVETIAKAIKSGANKSSSKVNRLDNLRLMHANCHRTAHSRHKIKS